MPAAAGSLEHEVLRAAWRLEKCTVREVHDLVGAPKGLSYMTTAKVLVRLQAKGILTSERDGTNVYRAPALPPSWELALMLRVSVTRHIRFEQ